VSSVLFHRQIGDPNIFEVKVCSRVVGLQRNGPRREARLIARIHSLIPSIVEIGNLDAVHPYGNMPAGSHNRFGKVDSVTADNPPRRLKKVKPARAEIDRFCAISILELVSDLGLVAAPKLAFISPKEDAAVGVMGIVPGVCPHVEL